jgi:hypothetical protein
MIFKLVIMTVYNSSVLSKETPLLKYSFKKIEIIYMFGE